MYRLVSFRCVYLWTIQTPKFSFIIIIIIVWWVSITVHLVNPLNYDVITFTFPLQS